MLSKSQVNGAFAAGLSAYGDGLGTISNPYIGGKERPVTALRGQDAWQMCHAWLAGYMMGLAHDPAPKSLPHDGRKQLPDDEFWPAPMTPYTTGKDVF